MAKRVATVILGAGPTGLGAAYRLHERGETDWLVLEKNNYAGGLATTFTDQQGFLWDIGGHVVHSHYKYFDQVFAKHILKNCNKLQREAWVWLADRFVPYPFQYNLHHLPEKLRVACVKGLKNRSKAKPPKNESFRHWIVRNFGTGIAEHFLFPLNQKTWGTPLDEMSAVWVGDRVATIDLKRVLNNIAKQKDDVAWGPNHVFYFPKQGGTGAIWRTIADTLPAKNLKLNTSAVRINFKQKLITDQHGKQYQYQTLVSSLPLTHLLDLADSPLAPIAHDNLKASTVHVVGLGLSGVTPEHLKTKCWMYFPEENAPFFRATVFSNYARANVPKPGKQWSLMCEVAETPHQPISHDDLVQAVIQGAINTRLIQSADDLVSTWHYRAPLGYPIPTLSRDGVIDDLLHELQQQAVYSRGRFGAWKYEISNMDHSFMQGVEAVDHILEGTPETTVWNPAEVNK